MDSPNKVLDWRGVLGSALRRSTLRWILQHVGADQKLPSVQHLFLRKTCRYLTSEATGIRFITTLARQQILGTGGKVVMLSGGGAAAPVSA